MSLNIFSTIPSQILVNKNLESNARLLFGLLTSLTNNEYGYCWASNQYFAETFDVDVRTIIRWLNSLKKEKVIKVEVTKVGIKTHRKIWICLDFQKMFAKGHFCHPRGDIFVTQPTPSPYIHNNITKEIYIAEQAPNAVAEAPATSPSLLQKKKKQPPIKIEVAPSVWLTEKQQEVILKQCNGDEQKRKECYEICSTWKIENSDDQNDFYRFKKWVYAKYDKLREAPPEEKRIARNKELAEKVKAKYDHHPDIYVGPSYIEIRTNHYAMNINYLDTEFKKKLIPALAAKGWGTNWLKEV
jgi:Helix-turn-helix domain